MPTLWPAGLYVLAFFARLRADPWTLNEVPGGAGGTALALPALDGDRCGAGPSGAAVPTRPLRGAFTEGVSRIDLHADMQGWHLRTADLDRFVGYGRHRRAFEDNRQVFQSGSRLSGFMFGRDALVARIYDKTAQIRKDGISWLPDLWGENFDPGAPVWRVEFQFRREAIADFQARTVDEVIASVQDVWRYGSVKWLTLRLPTGDPRRRRWRLDPAWEEVQAVRIAPTMTGLVRRRIDQASELRLLQGIQGYATSLAAVRGRNGREEAMRTLGL